MLSMKRLAGMVRRTWEGAANPRHRSNRVRFARQLHVEKLEDRLCPSGGYLLVSSLDTDSVIRYDETTGAYVDTFVPPKSGGLRHPANLIFGPDHNLYVGSGTIWDSGDGHKAVLRYNGTTGAFLDDFADANQVTDPRTVLFGPDGNLYVDDGNGTGAVLRYDGTTGAFLGDFVPYGSGGLSHPSGMVFGPDGKNDGKLDLYVASAGTNNVLHFDGTTGAFLGQFVPSGSGGLDHGCGMVFGPDGNLYIADLPAPPTTSEVLRYEGPNGPNPGAFLGTFIPSGSGGLGSAVQSLLFGPDGKNDGKLDLYVGTSQFLTKGFPTADPGTSKVLRYDGRTGAFIDTFVTPDSGGLQGATAGMTFTETDPTTLNYDGPGPRSALTTAAPATPTQLAAATPTATISSPMIAGSGSAPFAPALASPARGSSSFDPAPVPIVLGNALPARVPSPVPPSSPAPLPVSSGSVNPPPAAGQAANSPQPAWISASAADEVFAGLNAQQPLRQFVDDLALAGWSPDGLVAAPSPG